MALVHIIGCEGGTYDISKFSGYSGASIISSSGLSMDGSYCLSCNSNTNYVDLNVNNYSEVYMAFMYRHIADSSRSAVVSFYNGSTRLATLQKYDLANVFKAIIGTTAVETSAESFGQDITFDIELYFKMADAGGRFVVLSNGLSVIDYTGDTKTGTDATFNIIRLGYAGSSSYYAYCYFDNILVDNSSWIGKQYIQAVVPSGAGATTGMTASSGSNFQCVDEKPASDLDYVYTNVNDTKDTYAMGNLAGTIGTIKAMCLNIRAIKNGAATPQNIKPVVRSSGTDYEGAAIALPTSYTTLPTIYETDPAGGSITEAGFNAFEMGQKAVA